ncbi:MAG: leucine-rich repeat protein [Lentimicrobiaceae bacterium]|nr:leucine-rich repeat protein [Lentimicrobiaceae bacterium]
MKHKLLFLWITLLFNMANAMAQGGTTGPLTWNLEDGILTISGEGAIPDYNFGETPWYSYRTSIHTVVMELGITGIGNNAFGNCTNLLWASIPNGVTGIGDAAFGACKIPLITIPNSVSTIGDYAFAASGITSLTIPNSVTTIGELAFFNCTALISVTLPNSITSIGNYAFRECFFLTTINIPNSLTSIAEGLFYVCRSLSSIIIPNSITSIGKWAFCDCPIASITIPGSVTAIGDYAFYYCLWLTSIEVENGNPNYVSDDGILFNKNKTTIISYPSNRAPGEYQIPNSVKNIGNGAFDHCVLTSIIIPDGVTTIGDRAFDNCIALPSITIPNQVISIGEYAFSFCLSLTSITIPEKITTITEGAFEGCLKLTSIILPNSITSIGDIAFLCCGITLITLPNSLITIGERAFIDSKLTSIIIPNCVTTIGEGAFLSCKSMSSVTLPKSLTILENIAFRDCKSLTLINNLNPDPIFIDWTVFQMMPQSACTLKVATSAVTKYQNAQVWKNFNIVGGGFLVNPVTDNLEYGCTTGDALYEANEMATVSATAYSGYKFVNWTLADEEVSCENPYIFPVTEDVELVAHFKEIETYRVSVSVNNDEYGTATGSGLYEENKTVTVKATAYSGYKFVNWTIAGVEVSSENPYSFPVTKDVELVAHFKDEVGINELGIRNYELGVYPNPTSGELRIRNYELGMGALSEVEVEVYDVYGRKQKAERRKGEEEKGEMVINVEHLTAGIYLVRVATEKGVATKKVIKY